MENKKPVDYQAVIDSMRREEHKPDNPVRTTEIPYIQTKTGKHVDYQKASDIWKKEQAGKHTLYISEQEDEGNL